MPFSSCANSLRGALRCPPPQSDASLLQSGATLCLGWLEDLCIQPEQRDLFHRNQRWNLKKDFQQILKRSGLILAFVKISPSPAWVFECSQKINIEEAQRWLNLNPFGVSNICRECRLLYFIIIIVIIICWLLTSALSWRQRISIFTGGMPSTWKQSLQGTRPLHVLLCLSLCLFWFLQRLDQEDGGEIQFGQRASDPLTEFCGWNILIGFWFLSTAAG